MELGPLLGVGQLWRSIAHHQAVGLETRGREHVRNRHGRDRRGTSEPLLLVGGGGGVQAGAGAQQQPDEAVFERELRNGAAERRVDAGLEQQVQRGGAKVLCKVHPVGGRLLGLRLVVDVRAVPEQQLDDVEGRHFPAEDAPDGPVQRGHALAVLAVDVAAGVCQHVRHDAQVASHDGLVQKRLEGEGGDGDGLLRDAVVVGEGAAAAGACEGELGGRGGGGVEGEGGEGEGEGAGEQSGEDAVEAVGGGDVEDGDVVAAPVPAVLEDLGVVDLEAAQEEVEDGDCLGGDGVAEARLKRGAGQCADVAQRHLWERFEERLGCDHVSFINRSPKD